MSKPYHQSGGGSAFPVTYGNSESGLVSEGGLNIRDYFAAMAMQGLLSDQREGSAYTFCNEDELADMAYKYATAMLGASWRLT